MIKMATFVSWLRDYRRGEGMPGDQEAEAVISLQGWWAENGRDGVRSISGVRKAISAAHESDQEKLKSWLGHATWQYEQTRNPALASVTELPGAQPPEAADAQQWGERAAEGRKAPLTGSSSADLDAAYQAATGQEPPPYVPAGYRDADRELAVGDSRRLVWIELALRMILGERAAEIDAVMDAALLPETDLVAAFATADLEG